MLCKKCGCILSDDDEVCINCGTVVQPSDIDDAKPNDTVMLDLPVRQEYADSLSRAPENRSGTGQGKGKKKRLSAGAVIGIAISSVVLTVLIIVFTVVFLHGADYDSMRKAKADACLKNARTVSSAAEKYVAKYYSDEIDIEKMKNDPEFLSHFTDGEIPCCPNGGRYEYSIDIVSENGGVYVYVTCTNPQCDNYMRHY